MAEIGSGSVPSYPTSLDTDIAKEVASPSASKTKATADWANDVAAAAIAAETEIGIRGAATADVRSTINLEHVATGAHTTAAPANIIKQTASAGTGTTVSRADHLHDVTVAAPVNTTKAANAEGVATSLSRSDHKHDVTTAVVVATGTVLAEGTSTSLARADHVHTPGALTIGTGGLKTATGVATSATNTPIGVTMNDYSFFPSFVKQDSNGANMNISTFDLIDPGDTVGRIHIGAAGPNAEAVVRWRYITASDNPHVWISFNAQGGIMGVWMSDDPTPDGSPGVVGYDSSGVAGKSILIPRVDLGKLITGIPQAKIALGKKKSTTPDKEPFRIMWEAFKNPADEIIKRAKIVGGKLEAR